MAIAITSSALRAASHTFRSTFRRVFLSPMSPPPSSRRASSFATVSTAACRASGSAMSILRFSGRRTCHHLESQYSFSRFFSS